MADIVKLVEVLDALGTGLSSTNDKLDAISLGLSNTNSNIENLTNNLSKIFLNKLDQISTNITSLFKTLNNSTSSQPNGSINSSNTKIEALNGLVDRFIDSINSLNTRIGALNSHVNKVIPLLGKLSKDQNSGVSRTPGASRTPEATSSQLNVSIKSLNTRIGKLNNLVDRFIGSIRSLNIRIGALNSFVNRVIPLLRRGVGGPGGGTRSGPGGGTGSGPGGGTRSGPGGGTRSGPGGGTGGGDDGAGSGFTEALLGILVPLAQKMESIAKKERSPSGRGRTPSRGGRPSERGRTPSRGGRPSERERIPSSSGWLSSLLSFLTNLDTLTLKPLRKATGEVTRGLRSRINSQRERGTPFGKAMDKLVRGFRPLFRVLGPLFRVLGVVVTLFKKLNPMIQIAITVFDQLKSASGFLISSFIAISGILLSYILKKIKDFTSRLMSLPFMNYFFKDKKGEIDPQNKRDRETRASARARTRGTSGTSGTSGPTRINFGPPRRPTRTRVSASTKNKPISQEEIIKLSKQIPNPIQGTQINLKDNNYQSSNNQNTLDTDRIIKSLENLTNTIRENNGNTTVVNNTVSTPTQEYGIGRRRRN